MANILLQGNDIRGLVSIGVQERFINEKFNDLIFWIKKNAAATTLQKQKSSAEISSPEFKDYQDLLAKIKKTGNELSSAKASQKKFIERKQQELATAQAELTDYVKRLFVTYDQLTGYSIKGDRSANARKFFDQDRFEDAVKEFSQVDLNTEFAQITTYASHLQTVMGKELVKAKILSDDFMNLAVYESKLDLSPELIENILDHFDKSVQLFENYDNRFQQGKFFQLIERNYEAIASYEKAFKLYIPERERTDQDRATLLNNLGLALQEVGQIDLAISYLEGAYNAGIEKYGKESDEAASYLNNLSLAYFTKGDFDSSIKYLTDAIEVGKKVSGENAIGLALYYRNLGMAYKARGQLDRALTHMQKALSMEKAEYGEDSPKLSGSLNTMGLVLLDKRDFAQAITLLEKALAIDIKSYGETNPLVATRYNNLGSAFQEKGDLDMAFSCIEKALMIDLNINEKSPDVAIRYNDLGCIHQDKRQYEDALYCFNKSLEIDAEIFGKDSSIAARRLNNIGLLYQDINDLQKATQYLREALAAHVNAVGDNNTFAATIYGNLGVILMERGMLDEAFNNVQKSIDIYQELNEGASLAGRYNSMALIWDKRRDKKKALHFLNLALAILQKDFQQDTKLLGIVEANLRKISDRKY